VAGVCLLDLLRFAAVNSNHLWLMRDHAGPTGRLACGVLPGGVSVRLGAPPALREGGVSGGVPGGGGLRGWCRV